MEESETIEAARPRSHDRSELGREKIPKLMMRFAIPAIISTLITAVYNIVDQIFIGQKLGPVGNAATTVAFPVSTVCAAAALLVGVGGASYFNLEMGRGNREKAGDVAGTALGMLAVFGVLIALVLGVFLQDFLYFFGADADSYQPAFDYTFVLVFGIPFLIFSTASSHLIRADGSPKYAMACIVTGAVLNCILDPIFIFTLDWGMTGAALATILGQIVAGIMALLYYFRFKTVRLGLRRLLPRPRLAGKIAALGAASCCNQLAMTAVQITMNNTLTRYGAESAYGTVIPKAVVGIISKFNVIFMAFILGTSQGCQPIIGYNYGAKNYARVKKTYLLAAAFVTGVSLLAFLCCQFLPRQITAVFGSDGGGQYDMDLYFRFAERFFRIYMAMVLVIGIQPLTSTLFTSIGKSQKGVLLSLTRQIIILLPLILLMAHFLGIDGVMYAGPIADAAAFLLAVGLVWWEFKKMNAEEVPNQTAANG